MWSLCLHWAFPGFPCVPFGVLPWLWGGAEHLSFLYHPLCALRSPHQVVGWWVLGSQPWVLALYVLTWSLYVLAWLWGGAGHLSFPCLPLYVLQGPMFPLLSQLSLPSLLCPLGSSQGCGMVGARHFSLGSSPCMSSPGPCMSSPGPCMSLPGCGMTLGISWCWASQLSLSSLICPSGSYVPFGVLAPLWDPIMGLR